MVAVPAPPVATFTLGAEEVRLKPGTAAVTVRAKLAVAEMAPDVAVMMAFAVPTDAEALAVSVSVLVDVALAGLNAAVTPVGNPAIERLAAPVKPFCGVIVTVLVPDIPCETRRVAGAAASLKLGAGATVKPIVAEADDAPWVPVTVTVATPSAAMGDALNVTLLEVAVVDGLNAAVTPLGRPAIARATVPLNPVLGVTVMVSVTTAPCATLSAERLAASVKSAGGATVRVIPVVALRLPDLPVTVTAAAPTAALAPAVKLNVLAVEALAGLNDAVTPLGRPERVRLTALLNPFVDWTAILAAAAPP